MERTIGVITLGKPFLLTNYGTFLQHLALRTYIQELGFDSRRVRRLRDRPLNKPLILRMCKRIINGFRLVISRRANFVEEMRSVLCYIAQGYYFEKGYKLTLGGFSSDVSIGDCGKVVIGGDQVWGGTDWTQFGRDSGLAENVERISYAVSADWKKVSANAEWLEMAKSELAGFSAVSVREQAGVDFLNREILLRGRAVRVSDPVFLHPLDFYFDLAGKDRIFRKPTLFCYFVNMRAQEDFALPRFVDAARNLGVELKMLGIQSAERYVPSRYRITASPFDFIRLMRDAEYIVTNSFHGACFAILFRKRFVCLSQVEVKGASQNTRAAELLQRMGLRECLLDASSDSSRIASALGRTIDYDAVDLILSEEREMSRKWLRDALG